MYFISARCGNNACQAVPFTKTHLIKYHCKVLLTFKCNRYFSPAHSIRGYTNFMRLVQRQLFKNRLRGRYHRPFWKSSCHRRVKQIKIKMHVREAKKRRSGGAREFLFLVVGRTTEWASCFALTQLANFSKIVSSISRIYFKLWVEFIEMFKSAFLLLFSLFEISLFLKKFTVCPVYCVDVMPNVTTFPLIGLIDRRILQILVDTHCSFYCFLNISTSIVLMRRKADKIMLSLLQCNFFRFSNYNIF